MRKTSGEQGQGEHDYYAETHPEKEQNPVPWIQKYLELADLLIARVKHKREREQFKRTKPQPVSDAVRSAQQRKRA